MYPIKLWGLGLRQISVFKCFHDLGSRSCIITISYRDWTKIARLTELKIAKQWEKKTRKDTNRNVTLNKFVCQQSTKPTIYSPIIMTEGNDHTNDIGLEMDNKATGLVSGYNIILIRIRWATKFRKHWEYEYGFLWMWNVKRIFRTALFCSILGLKRHESLRGAIMFSNNIILKSGVV